MKGVGKFGEVMAGEKGKVSYDEVAARLEKIIHSGSQRKPITDFVCRELRKIPHYTWVGIYNVDGSELVLASWSGPSATLHLRIPIGEAICGAAVTDNATVIVPDVNDDPRALHLLQVMREGRWRDGHLVENLLVGRPLPFHEEVDHLQGHRLPQEREDLLLRLREGGADLRLTRRRSRIESFVLPIHRGRD